MSEALTAKNFKTFVELLKERCVCLLSLIHVKVWHNEDTNVLCLQSQQTRLQWLHSPAQNGSPEEGGECQNIGQ